MLWTNALLCFGLWAVGVTSGVAVDRRIHVLLLASVVSALAALGRPSLAAREAR